jgi:hypothetical protein
MARLALTPTQLTKASILQVTANLQSLGSNTGVQWVNSGREFLIMVLGSTASTLTENIELTIQGASVVAPTAVLTVSATQIVGPFSTQFNSTDGANNIFLDFSSTVGLQVMLCQMVGVS